MDDLAVFVGDEGGHGPDTGLLGDLRLLIDVDLVEADVGVLLLAGELLEDGADHFARTAPGSREVNDDGLVAVDLKVA